MSGSFRRGLVVLVALALCGHAPGLPGTPGIPGLPGPGSAAAATLTHTDTRAIAYEGITSGIEFDLFDPNLGALQSVMIGVSSDGFTYTTPSYANRSGVRQTGTINIIPRVLIAGSVAVGDGLNRGLSFETVVAPYDVEPWYNFVYTGEVGAFEWSTIASDNRYALAAYSGWGRRAVGISIAQMTGLFSGGYQFEYVGLGERVIGQITTTITYTYQPIPEPATAGLLAVVASAALLRRRR